MTKKFKVVFTSQNNDFKFSKEETKAIMDSNANISFEYIDNNTLGLPNIYNSFLNNSSILDYDYVIFMHADVKLDIIKLFEHIESVDGKYDVIGLCGCSKISVGQSPLNWFCGSRPFPNSRWGCVTHGELGNQMSFFSSHSPDVLDHEVSCIDGLCIIFSKNAIKSGLRFDESISPFDFYDTDISLQAILKYNLKLGVLVHTDLQHYSVGKSITTQTFLDNEKKFRSKWNF